MVPMRKCTEADLDKLYEGDSSVEKMKSSGSLRCIDWEAEKI